MPKLTITALSKTFGAGPRAVTALQGVDLAIGDNEFLSLVGTSGCGKSTLLSIVAGLESHDEGEVLVDGVPVDGPGLDRGVVFQSYTLFPWLTAQQNVEFALKEAGMRGKDAVDAARDHLKLVGLDGFADSYPRELSGGMKQRVAIARALSYRPKMLLMDEPFGALDALTRAHLQDELLKIVARTKSTMVMVTHDVDEAVLLSDRIVMMTNGPAATIGEILRVDLKRPRNRVELAEDPTYVHLRKEVIDFLYTRHARNEALAAA